MLQYFILSLGQSFQRNEVLKVARCNHIVAKIECKELQYAEWRELGRDFGKDFILV